MAIVQTSLLVAIGGAVGAFLMWWPVRKRPTTEQLHFTNRLYQRKAEEYKILCQDVLTGLDLVGHYVAALQLSQPNETLDKVLSSIHSLQTTIVSRSEDSHVLTPFQEINPFSTRIG